MSTASKGPLLVCTALAGEGHFFPVLGIAAYMRSQGYEVVFVIESNFKSFVENAGIEHVDSPSIATPELMAQLGAIHQRPAGVDTLSDAIKAMIVDPMPLRFKSFHKSLGEIKARNQQRDIVIVEDAFNMLSLPYWHGAPLPKGFTERPKSVGLGCAPLMMESSDIAPLMLGLPPDSTESGKARNRVINKLVREGPQKPQIDAWVAALKMCGCPSLPEIRIWNTGYESYDLCYQLCSPSLEYPISDLPANMSFAGVMPRREVPLDYKYPEWWQEIMDARRKDIKVVFVCQGTINTDHSQLVVPTMAALTDQPNIMVVAALGAHGASLPSDVKIPSNSRVVDYIPFDLILEQSDAFVTNCGYGAFSHAIKNGCPIVASGETEEKLEVALRAAYAGVAVDLETQKPSPGQVRDGVREVLGDEKYKRRAMVLRKENEDMDVFGTVKKGIESLSKSFISFQPA